MGNHCKNNFMTQEINTLFLTLNSSGVDIAASNGIMKEKNVHLDSADKGFM